MYIQMLTQTIERPRKSVPLTDEQHAAFEKWVQSQGTKVDAALSLGVQRGTLDRIMAFKSGSPETISRILGVIEAQK